MTRERNVLQSNLHQHGGAVAALQAEATQALNGANAQVQLMDANLKVVTKANLFLCKT